MSKGFLKMMMNIFIFGDRNRRRDNGKLYFMVCVIKKLLQPIIPNDTLESDLASLFAKYPFADKRKNTYLGFPSKIRKSVFP